MTPFGIASTVFGLLKSIRNTASSEFSGMTPSILTASTSDFSLALERASQQSESIRTLLSARSGSTAVNSTMGTDPLAFFGVSGTTTASALSALGRNPSLVDPEAAYRMMSLINKKDVDYKAQFADLSALNTGVSTMAQAAQALKVDASMDSNALRSRLETFAAQYNDWISRFAPMVESGGVLDGVQAAEISFYELEQSIKNIFNGAAAGFQGLPALGIEVDSVTHRVSIDSAALETALAASKDGVVATINAFSAHFAQSAELLTADNNFIRNRLANLDRAIDYISDNKTALQQEFGTGDAATPTGRIAQALALYNTIHQS